MEKLTAYIAMDRRRAIALGETLPTRTTGAALFADVSGFTPLTATLLKELGLRRGPEELTYQLNRVYDALITQVHRYRGSVITFAGDAITCWFDHDDGRRATACGLMMQQKMTQFKAITTPAGSLISLAMKAAVAAGTVRRFVVGDPAIQYIDVLAGETLIRMAAGEGLAEKGDVIVDHQVMAQIGSILEIAEFRVNPQTGDQFAHVSGFKETIQSTAWSALALFLDDEELAELADEQCRPWIHHLIYERLQKGQGQYLAEIRPITSLFMRFEGIDYDRDEQAGQKLDAYMRWMQSIINRYEGLLMQFVLGDKGCYILAGFGTPVAHENDPARAVATALELQATPPEFEFIQQVTIGISQGRTRVGPYGSASRHIYSVMGDEVNMAARLMGKAKSGQIMISAPVAEIVASSYQLQDLGQIQVKGKVEPLSVFLVLGRRWSSIQTAISTPLVGRQVELSQLDQLLNDCLTNHQDQLCRIIGDTGIGKSHLLTEFTKQAHRRQWQVVLGSCETIDRDISYYPWRQIVRRLLSLPDDLSPEAQITALPAIVQEINPNWLIRLPLLGDLLDLPIPDNPTTASFKTRLRQEALFALVIGLIKYQADRQPTVLIIEDIHWMDEASRYLTLAVSRMVEAIPFLLIIAHRPALNPDQPILGDLKQLATYHELDLNELPSSEVERIIQHRLTGQPTRLLTSLVVSQAKGNPLFAEELINALRDLGHVVSQESTPENEAIIWDLSEPMTRQLHQANCLIKDQAGQWVLNPTAPLSGADWGLPDSIHKLVLSRFDHLLEDYKLTLKVASVIGRFFGLWLLAKAHPLEQNEPVLQEQLIIMEEYEFVLPVRGWSQISYMFKHNLTREVTYETLLVAQQRDLHRTVAEALEILQPEAVEQLAYHYSQAELRPKMLFYLDKAARKTQREYTNETALAYYEQALAIEDRWPWRQGQIEILHLLGRREAQQAALESLAANPAAPPFELAYLWGEYYEAISHYAEAQTAIQKAWQISQQAGQLIDQARCLAQLGLIARRQGNYKDAEKWYQQAIILFAERTACPPPEAEVLVQALIGLGTVHRQQGAFEEATGCYQEALTLSRQHSNQQAEAEVLNGLGVTAFYQHTLAEALQYHEQAWQIRQTIGDRPGEGTSLYNLALVSREVGDYGQAKKYLSEALMIQQATGNRWEEVNVWNELGILYQELGDFSQAESYCQRGIALAQEIGDEVGQAYLECNLALVMRDQNQFAAAEQLLIKNLEMFVKEDNQYEISFYFSYLGTVNLQAGQWATAIEQAKRAFDLRQALDMPLNAIDDLATLAAAYWQQGDLAQAVKYTHQLLTSLDNCNGEGPELPQRDYFICYQVLAVAGQPERANSALQSAYDLVRQRSQKIIDPTLRQSFLEQVPVNHQIVTAYATGS